MFLNSDSNQTTEISNLLNGKLRIDFRKITLSRRKNRISGNGYLYQDEDKILKLVFFRNRLISQNKELEKLLSDANNKGGVQDNKCNINAIDSNGRKYSALCNICFEKILNVNEFTLHKIKLVTDNFVNRLILWGKYTIPFNDRYSTLATYKPFQEKVFFDTYNRFDRVEYKFEQLNRVEKDILKLSLSKDIELSLSNFDSYVDVLIESRLEINESTKNKIIHVLEFILGTEIRTAYYSIKNMNICYFSYKIKHSISLMFPPIIRKQEPEVQKEYSALASCYFKFIDRISKEDYLKVLRSHRRILSAASLYPFNFGQSLSIQIEYISSEFLKSYLILLDEETFKTDVKGLIEFVRKSSFENSKSKKWIVDRLAPGISKEKFTPSKLIRKLIEDKAVVGNYESWYNLRHSSAHGNDTGLDHIRLLQKVFDCIEIYYTLIYFIIKYEGYYTYPRVDDYAILKKYLLPKKNLK